ncbi:hypothetical protein BKA62DRAFT_697847 [Auriculariales sp. MPI-PUGE-AT-0066]|nr:hypothetical protein BKA62DRAFT_697847 [Auriculariales sp. MPI-PUGE-AT-0066]
MRSYAQAVQPRLERPRKKATTTGALAPHLISNAPESQPDPVPKPNTGCQEVKEESTNFAQLMSADDEVYLPPTPRFAPLPWVGTIGQPPETARCRCPLVPLVDIINNKSGPSMLASERLGKHNTRTEMPKLSYAAAVVHPPVPPPSLSSCKVSSLLQAMDEDGDESSSGGESSFVCTPAVGRSPERKRCSRLPAFFSQQQPNRDGSDLEIISADDGFDGMGFNLVHLVTRLVMDVEKDADGWYHGAS